MEWNSPAFAHLSIHISFRKNSGFQSIHLLKSEWIFFLKINYFLNDINFLLKYNFCACNFFFLFSQCPIVCLGLWHENNTLVDAPIDCFLHQYETHSKESLLCYRRVKEGLLLLDRQGCKIQPPNSFLQDNQPYGSAEGLDCQHEEVGSFVIMLTSSHIAQFHLPLGGRWH